MNSLQYSCIRVLGLVLGAPPDMGAMPPIWGKPFCMGGDLPIWEESPQMGGATLIWGCRPRASVYLLSTLNEDISDFVMFICEHVQIEK